jgi:hypothetical protein
MKRVILFFFVLLGLFVNSYSALTDDNKVYLSFDEANISGTTAIDQSINSNNFTCNNMGVSCTLTDGIINTSTIYDGNNDYLRRVSSSDFEQDIFSISLWFYPNASSTQEYLFFKDAAGNNNGDYNIIFQNDETVDFILQSGSGQLVVSSSPLSLNQWHLITVTYNRTSQNASLYLNGSYVNSGSINSNTASNTNNIDIGAWGGTTNYFTGRIDEVSYWARDIQLSEIQQLYNNGSAHNPYEPPAITGGVIFNYPTNNSYINSLNFTLNVSFTVITNSTYSFNGASNVTLGTNANNSFTNLSGVEGLNNLTVYTNTSGELNQSSISFTIDLNPPSLNVSLPAEYNAFTGFNFSEYISFNDANIDSCQVNISGETSTTCTDSSYSFTTSGNKTINVTVTDLAGNVNQSLNNLLLVNPLAYIYIQDNTSDRLNNFTINGREDINGGVNFSYYNDNLTIGSNTLEFSKVGYITQNIIFNLSTSAPYFNQTYTVQDAIINIDIRDKETGAIVSGPLFSLEFIASVGLVTNTTIGEKSVTNTLFQNEQYKLTVSADNYSTETVFFDFTNQEELDLTVYVLQSNATNVGIVEVKVVDKFGKAIQGAIAQALQWDSSTSSFIRVSEGLTAEDGITLLNIILDTETYIFQASQGGLSKNTSQQRIPELLNGKQIVISLDEGPTEISGLLENIEYDLQEIFDNETYTSNITLSFSSTDGTDVTGCIRYSRLQPSGTRTTLSEDCTTGAVVSNFMVSKTLNSSYYVLAEVGFKIDGLFYVVEDYKYNPLLSISNVLKDTNIALYILPLLYLVAVLVGMVNPLIGAALLILNNLLAVFLIPQYVNGPVFAFMYLIAGLIMYAGGKRR